VYCDTVVARVEKRFLNSTQCCFNWVFWVKPDFSKRPNLMASGLFMSFKFQCSKHFVISGARNLNRIKFTVVFRWVYPIKPTGFFVICLSVSTR